MRDSERCSSESKRSCRHPEQQDRHHPPHYADRSPAHHTTDGGPHGTCRLAQAVAADCKRRHNPPVAERSLETSSWSLSSCMCLLLAPHRHLPQFVALILAHRSIPATVQPCIHHNSDTSSQQTSTVRNCQALHQRRRSIQCSQPSRRRCTRTASIR